MEILATFVLLIGLLLIPLALMARLILPKGFGVHFLARLARDVFLGIWHFVFGPPKVRIMRDNKSPRWRFGGK